MAFFDSESVFTITGKDTKILFNRMEGAKDAFRFLLFAFIFTIQLHIFFTLEKMRLFYIFIIILFIKVKKRMFQSKFFHPSRDWKNERIRAIVNEEMMKIRGPIWFTLFNKNYID